MPELFGSEYGRLGIETGDTGGSGADILYDGALKVNRNFLEIYDTYGDGNILPLPGTVGKWDQTNIGISTINSVGIGTTIPTEKLTVLGSVGIGGSLIFNDTAGIATVIVAIGTQRFLQHSIVDCGEY